MIECREWREREYGVMEFHRCSPFPVPKQEIQNRGRGIQSSFRRVKHELLGTRALAIATMETKETRQATPSMLCQLPSFGFSTLGTKNSFGEISPLIQGK